MPIWILKERGAQAYSWGSSSLRSSFALRFGASVPLYTFTLASATRYATELEAGHNTTVEMRLFSSFPRPPPCHPTCPSSSSLPGNGSCPFSSPSAIPLRRAYASILATTCCIRTALNSSSDLDLVHPHKYDVAASIASCDVGLPRQSMQTTSSIGLPQQRSSGATRVSTARRLRSAAHERVGSTRAFLVRGRGWEHTGSERKCSSENWSTGTSAAAAQHPSKSTAAAAQHERVVCEALEARTSSPAFAPLSLLASTARTGPAAEKEGLARMGWEREECVRAHKPRAPVMAGAHHLNLIRPAGYAGLPRSSCTTTTPVVRSIAIATSQLALPWAPGTSLAAHSPAPFRAAVGDSDTELDLARPPGPMWVSVSVSGPSFVASVLPSRPECDVLPVRGFSSRLRRMDLRCVDASGYILDPRPPARLLNLRHPSGLASCAPSPARLSPPPPPALVSSSPRPPPDLGIGRFPLVVSRPDFDVWTYAASTPAAIRWIPARRLASSVSVIPRDSPPALPLPLVSPRRRLPPWSRPRRDHHPASPPDLGIGRLISLWGIRIPLFSSSPSSSTLRCGAAGVA
ncbi:hypothetical protein B0H14DRAFT_3507819 [Mycena olivaceomarginata]|nr:hypothetical protein B0H14DRAFT_3507819 [Mycena olivaceomarginata]